MSQLSTELYSKMAGSRGTKQDSWWNLLRHSFRGMDHSASSGAYGNNFSIRRSIAAKVRFDERFRLYSWLEDFDFGSAAARLMAGL